MCGGRKGPDVFFPAKKLRNVPWEVVTGGVTSPHTLVTLEVRRSTYIPTEIVINCNLKINNLHTRRFLCSVRTE